MRDYAEVRGDGAIDAHGRRRRARPARGRRTRASTGSTARSSPTICERFAGGPVGLSTLAVAVGEEPDTIEDVYEPYLLQRGLLQRTPRGRCATAARLPRTSGSSRPPSRPRCSEPLRSGRTFSASRSTLSRSAWPICSSAPTAASGRPRPSARPASATSPRAARSAASASSSSCSTTTTRRPNAAFFVCDQQGRVIGCGRGSRELTGLSDEKVIGRPVRDVLGLDFDGGEDHVGIVLEWGVRAARQARRRSTRRAICPRRRSPICSRPTMTTAACCSSSRRRSSRRSSRPAMTDRRRNLFVLLIVVGLLAASLVVIFDEADASSASTSRAASSSSTRRKPTKQQPRSTPEALDRALDIMRERVDPLGVAEPELQRSGADQIEVSLPGVKNAGARRRPGRHHGPAVLLRLGAERPRRGLQDQPGRRSTAASSRSPGSTTRSSARRSARRRSTPTTRPTALFYAFDKKSQAAAQRRDPGRDARPTLERGPRRRRTSPTSAEILEVPEGVIVLRAEDERDPRPASAARSTSWWVLKDNPVLSGTDIKNPEQNFENGAGGAADRHVRVHRQGPQGVRRRPRARSPSAAPTTRRSTAACRTRSTPRTTSRSGSTTS